MVMGRRNLPRKRERQREKGPNHEPNLKRKKAHGRHLFVEENHQLEKGNDNIQKRKKNKRKKINVEKTHRVCQCVSVSVFFSLELVACL